MGANFYKNMFDHEILLLQNNECLPMAVLNPFMGSRLEDALLEGSSSEHTHSYCDTSSHNPRVPQRTQAFSMSPYPSGT